MNVSFHRVAATAAALLLGLLLGPAARAHAADAPWGGSVGLLAGAKFLERSGWRQTDTQLELGVKLDIGGRSWPVWIAADFLQSMARGSADVFLLGNLVRVRTDIFASTTEADFGLRKTWESHPRLRPSLGGGVALASARWRPRAAGISFPREDSGTGVWLSGGLSWLATESLTVGVEARWSTASLRLGGSEIDAGGAHAGVVAGWRW
jgi:hypothetical protein